MKLTVDGRWYGLVVAGFTVAALNTGANLLLALGGALAGVLAVNALLARRAVAELDASLHGPAQAAQGAPLELEVRLTHPGRRPSPPVIVSSPWCASPRAALDLGPEPRSVRLTPRLPLPRGRHALGEVQLLTDAPFGLVRAGVRLPGVHSVLVTPAVLPLRPGLVDAATRGDGAAPASWLQGAEQRDRVRGLREFRAGDSPRAIHWRSSARRGSLVVREFERGVPECASVVVRLAGAGDPERTDATLCLAASLVACLRARGERVGVAVLGRSARWVGSDGPLSGVLEAMALAEPGLEAELDLAARVRSAGGSLEPRAWLVTDAPSARLPGARRWSLDAAADLERWVQRPAPAAAVVGSAS